MDSAPSSSTVSRTVLLLLRVLTFVFLLIALILIAADKQTDDAGDKVKFSDVHAYRYMLSTIVIGFAYNLLQMALSIFTVVTGNRVLSGDGGHLFDFFGDKIISYLLLSGCAAGFGFTVEFRRGDTTFNSFAEKANASASLLLFGFLSNAIASVFTSFALPKKAN